MTNIQKGVQVFMKYQILAQIYKSAAEAISYISQEGYDEDGFHRDCVMSAVSSFQMAMRNYNPKTEVTPF